MKKLLSLTLFAASLMTFAQEGELRMPFNFENSKVLPENIRNVIFMHAEMGINERYNQQGSAVGIADSMNKSVTWAEAIDGIQAVDPTYAANLMGALTNAGINQNEFFGEVAGLMDIGVQAQVPVFAYGLNKRWTVAVAVPYVTTSYYVSAGGVNAGGSQLNFVSTMLQGTGNSQHKAERLAAEFLNAVDKKLSQDYGYNSIYAKNGLVETKMGDMRLVGKYQLTNQDKLSSALKIELTAPTGEVADADDAIAIGYGDGQWDIGLGLAADYRMNDSWEFSGFAGYTMQLAGDLEKRIPFQADSKASPDKETVNMNLGDQLKFQTAAKYSFFNGWSVTNGMTFQYKFADEATGTKYSQQRYDWLTQDTAQSMTAYTAGIGFSTIPLFRQKRFKAPINIDLFYTSVLAGQNIATSKFYTLQAAMFF